MKEGLVARVMLRDCLRRHRITTRSTVATNSLVDIKNSQSFVKLTIAFSIFYLALIREVRIKSITAILCNNFNGESKKYLHKFL